MEKMQYGKVCGIGHRATVPSLGEPLYRHLHVFTNLETLQTLCLQVFRELHYTA